MVLVNIAGPAIENQQNIAETQRPATGLASAQDYRNEAQFIAGKPWPYKTWPGCWYKRPHCYICHYELPLEWGYCCKDDLEGSSPYKRVAAESMEDTPIEHRHRPHRLVGLLQGKFADAKCQCRRPGPGKRKEWDNAPYNSGRVVQMAFFVMPWQCDVCRFRNLQKDLDVSDAPGGEKREAYAKLRDDLISWESRGHIRKMDPETEKLFAGKRDPFQFDQKVEEELVKLDEEREKRLKSERIERERIESERIERERIESERIESE